MPWRFLDSVSLTDGVVSLEMTDGVVSLEMTDGVVAGRKIPQNQLETVLVEYPNVVMVSRPSFDRLPSTGFLRQAQSLPRT